MRIVLVFLLAVLLLGCVTGSHKPSFPQEISDFDTLTSVDMAWPVSEQSSGRIQKSTIPQSVTDSELQSAIDSVRGINIQGISFRDKMQIGGRLDAAWNTLKARPQASKQLLHQALQNEMEDDFFLIDLSELYLMLDQKPMDLEDVSEWLVRADPNAYGDSYFFMASRMAASNCMSCRPAVLRMLDLEQLESYIEAHALPIDLDMGLLFTVVQYGEEIVSDVAARLSSISCVVRSNAAYALSMLLPPETPAEIEVMAGSDHCERARYNSMRSLAVIDPPALFRVLNNKMRDPWSLDESELLAIVKALELAPPRQSKSMLSQLSQHDDKPVASAARAVLDLYSKLELREQPPELFSSKDNGMRSRVISELTDAIQNKRYKAKRSPDDIIAALTVDDYAVLNKARLAVLRRLSDECLEEFLVLHATTLLFREAKRWKE